jgi:hypothetical protein
MELQYWIETFRAMTHNASMLTGNKTLLFENFIGFAFGAMYSAHGSEQHFLNLVFLSITACSMGFGLLCITTATLCLIFGTERALFGKDSL